MSGKKLPKLDGDWAKSDGLLFKPLAPIKIDEGGTAPPIVSGWGGRMRRPVAAAELVGTMLT
jgi:hypothetical protein